MPSLIRAVDMADRSPTETIINEEEGGAVTDHAPSMLDRLRARYQELATAEKETLYVVVGHGVGDLVIEYHEPDWYATQEIKQRWAASDHPRRGLYSAAAQLADSCVDVWIRDPEGRELRGVDGCWSAGMGLGEGPVRFERAAELLGSPLNPQAPHPEIQAVTAVLREDWEIASHSGLLAVWEPGSSQEVDDTFVGESEAAIPS
jgi:hypothetical protein